MFTLVIGGAGSGKSALAEEFAMASPCRPLYYIATMEPFGDEARARVAKHRRMRAGKGFVTLERYAGLSSLTLPERGTALLECLGNLTANELYGPAGAGTEEGAFTAVAEGVEALLAQCGGLVAVSNEVFSGGNRYAGDTDAYLRTLARINRALAAKADRVCEAACGLPRFLKGAEAWS